MSTGEILELLPKLGKEERREILDRLCALEEADCTESHQELIDEALRSGNAVLLQGVQAERASGCGRASISCHTACGTTTRVNWDRTSPRCPMTGEPDVQGRDHSPSSGLYQHAQQTDDLDFLEPDLQ